MIFQCKGPTFTMNWSNNSKGLTFTMNSRNLDQQVHQESTLCVLYYHPTLQFDRNRCFDEIDFQSFYEQGIPFTTPKCAVVRRFSRPVDLAMEEAGVEDVLAVDLVVPKAVYNEKGVLQFRLQDYSCIPCTTNLTVGLQLILQLKFENLRHGAVADGQLKRTSHGLQLLEAFNIFNKKSIYRELSEIAEQAKRQVRVEATNTFRL